jgi:hypothetical protein
MTRNWPVGVVYDVVLVCLRQTEKRKELYPLMFAMSFSRLLAGRGGMEMELEPAAVWEKTEKGTTHDIVLVSLISS